MDAQPKSKNLGIKLSVNPEGTLVVAELTPLGENNAPNMHQLKGEIKNQGFGEAIFEDKKLIELLKRWPTIKQTSSFEIGKITQAKVTILIAKNKLEAYLNIEKAQGGRPVSLEDVLAVIKKEGIKSGVIADAVKEAVAAGEASGIVIARGKAAVHGERAKFIPLIDNASDRRPNVKDDGSVDYREISDVLTVKAGTPLMRREPATKGTKGWDVKGRELAAKEGKDVPFSARCKNVKQADDDPNVLVAAIAGSPVIESDGMSVDPTVSVDKVDITTGNLDFDGTVFIKGDVLTGMRIKVTGDVQIAGMVEAAHVEAGGDIVIAGGVIGRGEVRDEKGNQNESAATLKAKGNIQARFVENAFVEADKDIIVKDLVSHSELKANGRIVVGGKGSSKGQIIGGLTVAAAGIEANSIGTAGGVATRIKVAGELAQWKDKLRAIDEKLSFHNAKLTQLQNLLAQLRQKQNPDEATIKKAMSNEVHLENEIQDMLHQKEELTHAIKRFETVKVSAKQHLFGGTELAFLDKTRTIKEDLGATIFQFENGIITQK